MGKIVKKPHAQLSIFKQIINQSKRVKDIQEDFFTLSLRHVDRNQGQTFENWDDKGILARAIQTIEGYSHQPLRVQLDKKFTIYGAFPINSTFTHPNQVPPDAEWARIHITGKQILAGHVFKNIFFLVFLDDEHEFWLTNRG